MVTLQGKQSDTVFLFIKTSRIRRDYKWKNLDGYLVPVKYRPRQGWELIQGREHCGWEEVMKWRPCCRSSWTVSSTLGGSSICILEVYLMAKKGSGKSYLPPLPAPHPPSPPCLLTVLASVTQKAESKLIRWLVSHRLWWHLRWTKYPELLLISFVIW